MNPSTTRRLLSALICALLLGALGGRARPAQSAQQASDLLSSYPSWEATGEQSGAEFGLAVAAAGDVNGDGFADLAVGAPKYDNGVSREGAAFVYYGSPSGSSAGPAWMDSAGGQGSGYGSSVAPAGDVNGDGFDDLVVGAPTYKNSDYQVGAAFLYHGSPEGLESAPAWQVTGEVKNAGYGKAAASAGDLNGDGFDDLIVGAPWYSDDRSAGGAVFVHHGSSVGLSPDPDWTYRSDQSGAGLGSAVASAGDVNADGYADVIVGAPHYNSGQSDEGVVLVFYGSPEGLGESPDLTLEANRAEISFGQVVSGAGDVNGDGCDDVIVSAPSLDSQLYFGEMVFGYYGSPEGLSPYANWMVQGDQLGSLFGWSADLAGDLDGDGFDDVAVGAHMYNYDNDDQSREGAVFVYPGGPEGLATQAAWTGFDLKGYTTEYGYALAGGGDVNADGFHDLLVGAPGFKLHTNEVVGRALLYKGLPEGAFSGFRVHLPYLRSHP